MNDNNTYAHLGFTTQDLVKLAQWEMPFGKYAGRLLVDLPEEYLFWFQKNEFPKGEHNTTPKNKRLEKATLAFIATLWSAHEYPRSRIFSSSS